MTQKMFEGVEKYNEINIPNPPNELAHIISHCVFDKEGKFSNYYIERCKELYQEVSSNKKHDQEFRELLQLIFYDAGELVQDMSASEQYNAMREKLREFDNY